jgi:hypothetical protein
MSPMFALNTVDLSIYRAKILVEAGDAEDILYADIGAFYQLNSLFFPPTGIRPNGV